MDVPIIVCGKTPRHHRVGTHLIPTTELERVLSLAQPYDPKPKPKAQPKPETEQQGAGQPS